MHSYKEINPGSVMRYAYGLNIGCGENIVDGWLNIGLFPEKRFPYGKIVLSNKAFVWNIDLRKDISIKEGSIKYIYASHFIEHLSFQQGMLLLGRCYDCLMDGGVIRLTFPNLEMWVRKYYENDMPFFQTYYTSLKKWLKLPYLKTKGEIFMSLCHGWGHKWLYDFESIKDTLNRAGFTEVTEKRFHESFIPNIKKLELSLDVRKLETCYVEAEK